MRQLIILIAIVSGSILHLHAQSKQDFSKLDGKTDTLNCDDKKMIVELSYNESNGLYKDGIVTDIYGKEEFCFIYAYTNKNKLKKITFWTYQYKNSGHITKDKIGVLKIDGDKQKLCVKDRFTLDRDFVKLVTKI